MSTQAASVDRQHLARVIKATAAYYSRDISADVLTMMLDDLADLSPSACAAGYQQYRNNPKNRAFPLPAQIRELVNPEEYVAVETQAREVAQRIVGAVSKYGWCNGKEAQVFIGHEGWALVQRMGGWSHFCEGLNQKQAPIVTAQLRDQLEGTFRYGQAAVEQSVGIGTTRESHGQLEAPTHSEMIRSILSRQPPGPEGA